MSSRVARRTRRCCDISLTAPTYLGGIDVNDQEYNKA
jgi:hypothetical protein